MLSTGEACEEHLTVTLLCINVSYVPERFVIGFAIGFCGSCCHGFGRACRWSVTRAGGWGRKVKDALPDVQSRVSAVGCCWRAYCGAATSGLLLHEASNAVVRRGGRRTVAILPAKSRKEHAIRGKCSRLPGNTDAVITSIIRRHSSKLPEITTPIVYYFFTKKKSDPHILCICVTKETRNII
ncbi:Protein of unknown function [Gryllus bimaculatus]|nr:Protein of unknown function [Gryllus bimaculatus]